MKNFFSAGEDLRERTLASFSAAVSRVLYLVSLQDPVGQLSHAGLERTYGPEAAHAALDDAFRAGCLEMLRVPLRESLQALRTSGGTPAQLRDAVRVWQREAGRVSPAILGHFSYAASALALALEERSANQAA